MKRNMQALLGAALFLALLAAVVCLIAVSLDNSQSGLPSPMPQAFLGEYSWDGQNWAPLTPESDLSADRGDLYLRGQFERAIPGGTLLNYYCNHIGVEIRIDGVQYGLSYLAEMQRMGRPLMRSMCGRVWRVARMPDVTPQSLVEIHLHNPHAYGNRNAYSEFLNTLCVTDEQNDLLSMKLDGYGMPHRIAGTVVMISALMILGASVAAVLMRLKMGAQWFSFGLLTLFSGMNMIYDAIDVFFWGELLVVNTYAWQLSAMLAVLSAGCCAFGSLTGAAKRTAGYALLGGAVLDTAIILLSLVGEIKIFDLLPVWAGAQLIVCPLLAGCCLWQIVRVKGMDLLTPVSGAAFFAAVCADVLGVGVSIFSRGTCSKTVFVVLFIVHIFVAGKSVADKYITSMQVDRMEKALEDSRVAIMLSQIQPHFLYNSLSVIQELCHSEPLEAEKAIGRFAEFLRGNMTALTSEKVIPFTDELHHIRSYLEIEKLRFGDQLRVCYEIEEEDFSLPTLTLQPLVENAVRHGVRRNENGGTVTISVKEHAACHEIVIRDDGPGFVPDSPGSADSTHVGIGNVKNRLERMCGGSLKIDSAPGCGTRVTVRIPKEGGVC